MIDKKWNPTAKWFAESFPGAGAPLKLMSGNPCLDLLAGAKRKCKECREGVGCIQRAAGFDHTCWWSRDGEPYAITTQPYGVSSDQVDNLLSACRVLGLRFEIDARSWHNYGSCVLIIIRRRERQAE